MADFTPIKHFVVKFMQSPSNPEAHTHLNNNYSDSLPNHERLDIDPTAQDELLDDIHLLYEIRTIIAEELISPYAHETPDLSNITSLIDKAVLFTDYNGNQHRLQKESLTEAMQHQQAAGKDTVEIKVSISHIYVDPSLGPISYLRWQFFSTNRPPPVAATTTLTATDIANAVAGALPAPLAAADLATAFASAYNGSTYIAPAIAPSSLYNFDSRTLPSDVLARYKNKLNHGLILGSTIRKPYAGGHFYHLEGTDKSVLADGALLFIGSMPNEEALTEANVYCKDDTPRGVREWYNNFARACHHYGFYAHPLWCFKSNHGGRRGFNVSSDVDDDLPSFLEFAI